MKESKAKIPHIFYNTSARGNICSGQATGFPQMVLF